MRLLIVKLSAIGDIIHTLPALAAVRRALPDAEITWVVEERSAEILRGNPLVDRLVEVDTRSMRGGKVIEEILLDLGAQVKKVREFKYDVAIDFQGLIKSAAITRLSGAKKRWGFSRSSMREPAGRVFLTNSVDVAGDVHIIRKNLELAAGALNIDVPNSGFEFPIATSESERAAARWIAQDAGGRFAVLNPAGGWVTKLWHAEKYGQLADLLWERQGLASIVATGPNELELADRAAAGSRTGRLTLAQPTLKAFFELARLAEVYIGGDTGPTHLAIAAGAPIVGIFGPTEWWRNGSTNP
ncbi:MAG: lipopolysaccharide heptosyltransferase I, partial [Acidobacteria bacterium]|nr:lipopolysaccharide heptosyltransferase I [Acidobacteriota bacterium]